MTQKLLSICIPTFNRPRELADCLRAIKSCVRDRETFNNLEIIISDNASTKDLSDTVAEFATELPIKYFRNDTNVGATANLVLATKRASGTYLWFFGDDDSVQLTDLALLMATLKTEAPALCFLPRLMCDRDLNIISGEALPNLGPDMTRFTTGKEMLSGMGTTIGTILGFYSSLVVRAENWHQALEQCDRNFGEWHHLATLLTAIVNKPVIIVPDMKVLCRTGNYRSFEVNSKIWLDDYINVFLYASTVGYTDAAMSANISHIINKHQKAYFKDQALGIRQTSFKTTLANLLRGSHFEAIRFHKTKWYYLSFAPQWALRLAFRALTLGRRFD